MTSTRTRGPWRWGTVVQAPHRLAFLAGMAMLALSATWWASEMVARLTGHEGWAQAVPPSVAHALWMCLGFLPLFFVGFLFTAGPKWLQLGEVPAAQLVPHVVAMVAGWGVFAAGVHGSASCAALGLGAVAAGWGGLVWRFAGLLRRSPARDRLHASLIAVVCVVGALLMLGMAVALWQLNWGMARCLCLLALWAWLVPVYMVVAHRMIPFFTASAVPVLDAWRPNWLLWTLLSLACAQAGNVVLAAWGVQPMWWRWSHGLASALLCGLVLALAVRWGMVQSLRIRLLAMLHVGFLWLGVAAGLEAGVRWAEAWQLSLSPLLPLHALTMGFLGSLLLAMVTRVSSGHGGRTLVADDVLWGLFWCLQLAVLTRLAAAAWPAWGVSGLVLAAALWAGGMGAWAARLGRWYGRPRLDGRAG